jgi:signal transduction histidine kinase
VLRFFYIKQTTMLWTRIKKIINTNIVIIRAFLIIIVILVVLLFSLKSQVREETTDRQLLDQWEYYTSEESFENNPKSITYPQFSTWQLLTEEEKDALPQKYEKNEKEEDNVFINNLWIKKQFLPEHDYEDPGIFIFNTSSRHKIIVWLDGEQIYNYGFFSKQDGFFNQDATHLISLPETLIGKEINIGFLGIDSEEGVPQIWVGSQLSLTSLYITDNLHIYDLVILFTGLVILLMGIASIVLWTRRRTRKEYLYFGLFAIFASMDFMYPMTQFYFALDNNQSQFRYFTAVFDGITRVMIFPFLLAFLQEIFYPKKKSIYFYIWIVSLVAALFISVMLIVDIHKWGVFDLETPFFLTLIASLWCVVTQFMKRNPEARIALIGISFLVLSSLLEVLEEHGLVNLYGLDLLYFGMVGFIFSLIVVLVTRFRKTYQQLGIYAHELEKRITEIKNAKAKDDAILGSIGEGIIAVDTSGKIILVNKVGAEWVSSSESDLLGKLFYEMFIFKNENDAYRILDKNNFESYISSTLKPVRYLANLSIKDGKQLSLRLSITPIIIDENIAGAVIVLVDRSSEMELIEAKNNFIGTIGHEFRTPLTKLKWVIEEFSSSNKDDKDKKDEDFQSNVMIASTTLDSISGLVEKLIRVSKVESGLYPYHPESFLIIDLVNEVTDSISGEKQEAVFLNVNIDKDNTQSVFTDKKALSDILKEILTNAYRFTEKGEVKVEIYDKSAPELEDLSMTSRIDMDQYIVMSVSDTGVGITKDAQRNVFSSFFQEGGVFGRWQQKGGLGVGLYLAKKLADQLQIILLFDSKKKEKTTFYIAIPKTKIESTNG